MNKQKLIDIIENFASQYQTKRYLGKFLGKRVLKAVVLNFVSFVEDSNDSPVVLIEIFKKSAEKLGTDPNKIRELEEEIQKLKRSKD